MCLELRGEQYVGSVPSLEWQQCHKLTLEKIRQSKPCASASRVLVAGAAREQQSALTDSLTVVQAWYLVQGQPRAPQVDSWYKFSGQVCIVNRDDDKYGNHRMTEGHSTLSRGQKSLQVKAAAREQS